MFGKLSATHDSNKTGCGLGLYICKQIVEKMRGLINLKSKYKEGTKVTLLFPLIIIKEKKFDINEDEIAF